MPTASLKFTQGVLTPPAGRALIGVAGSPVTVENGDNTGVVAWEFSMLSVPIGSAVPLGVFETTASGSFTPTALVPGGYRVKVKVTDAGGNIAEDIRVFMVVTSRRAWAVPAFQQDLFADEHNFDGQARGWAGDGVAAILLDTILGEIEFMLPFIDATDGEYVGSQHSFKSKTGGTLNTAVGYNAMVSHVSGNANTALGNGALGSLLTGATNTALGYSAGGALTGAENANILIGSLALGIAGVSSYLQIAANFIHGDLAARKLAIGNGVAKPTGDVQLRLKDTDKAFMPNVLTTAQRDALTPEAGMVIYNSTTKRVEFYDGTAWRAGGATEGLPVSAVQAAGPYTSTISERVRVNPAGGGFTVNAPASPVVNQLWSVKNTTTSANVMTIGGNGTNIEDPSIPGSYAASFNFGAAGFGFDFQYDGTNWILI